MGAQWRYRFPLLSAVHHKTRYVWPIARFDPMVVIIVVVVMMVKMMMIVMDIMMQAADAIGRVAGVYVVSPYGLCVGTLLVP